MTADRDDSGEPVGSLAEEAAKLFGALSGWASEHAGEAGEGLSGLAGHAAAAADQVTEHLATGSAECTICPICRTIHVVRDLSPEVRTHLIVAASSLAQAAAGFLATDTGGSEPPGPAMEDAHLTDEWPEDD